MPHAHITNNWKHLWNTQTCVNVSTNKIHFIFVCFSEIYDLHTWKIKFIQTQKNVAVISAVFCNYKVTYKYIENDVGWEKYRKNSDEWFIYGPRAI